MKPVQAWILSLLLLCSLVLFVSRPPRARGVAGAARARSSGPAVIDASRFPDLQAALDALPESGGVVRIPPGVFRITDPLVLSRSETRLVGAGAATRILNGNREDKPALILRAPTGPDGKRAKLWRIGLADFRICGDPDAVDARSTEPESGDGILAEGINEIYICGLGVDHCGGNGVHLVDCYEDPRIVNSILTYNRKAGLHLQACHDIVVSANQFEENQDALRCIDSFNLCMTGNNLDDHLRHGVVIENTYGSVLSGNMIEECQGTAVILDRDCYGITISANVLADNFGGGVDLRDAWGCTVSANTFTIDAVRALVIGPASGRIAVTGNNFSDSYVGAGTRRSGKPNLATGITLQGTRDIVISGNLFSGLDGSAVSADEDCSRLAVTGNVITAVQQKKRGRGPALDVQDARSSISQQNVITRGELPPAESPQK